MLCFPNFVHVRNKIYYLSKEQESQFRTSEEKVSSSWPQLHLNFSIMYFQSKGQVFLLFFRSGSRSGSLRASNGEDGGSDEEESGKKLVLYRKLYMTSKRFKLLNLCLFLLYFNFLTCKSVVTYFLILRT